MTLWLCGRCSFSEDRVYVVHAFRKEIFGHHVGRHDRFADHLVGSRFPSAPAGMADDFSFRLMSLAGMGLGPQGRGFVNTVTLSEAASLWPRSRRVAMRP